MNRSWPQNSQEVSIWRKKAAHCWAIKVYEGIRWVLLENSASTLNKQISISTNNNWIQHLNANKRNQYTFQLEINRVKSYYHKTLVGFSIKFYTIRSPQNISWFIPNKSHKSFYFLSLILFIPNSKINSNCTIDYLKLAIYYVNLNWPTNSLNRFLLFEPTRN